MFQELAYTALKGSEYAKNAFCVLSEYLIDFQASHLPKKILTLHHEGGLLKYFIQFFFLPFRKYFLRNFRNFDTLIF